MLRYHAARGLRRSLSRPRAVRRAKVHSTSLAVKGRSSCHRTPSRSLKVSSVPSSLQFHDSARSGTTDCSLFWALDWSNSTRLLNTGMKGTTVEALYSSWIEALGGLSRWNMRSTPPLFCASAAPLEHNVAATTQPIKTLERMLVPLRSTPHIRSRCRQRSLQRLVAVDRFIHAHPILAGVVV